MIGVVLVIFVDVESLANFCFIWIAAIYLSGLIAGIIFYRGYYRHHFDIETAEDTALRKVFVRYSLGTLLSANVGTLLHLLDSLFLGYFIGTTDV